MGKWTDLARQLTEPSPDRDNSDNRDNSPMPGAPAAPIGANVPIVTDPVDASMLAGLDRLATMAAPRISNPRVWPEIVSDAMRLVGEGWAATALALGWEPLHLWGCSPDRGGNTDHEGLAVVLAGRRIVLLDAGAAIIESGAGTHRLFNRRPMPGAVLLWDLGARA